MAYAWYPLWTAMAAIWALHDARRRLTSPWRWVGVTALGGPVGLACYLVARPLRVGESRAGGRPWQLASRFVVGWTSLLAWGALWNLAWPATPFATFPLAWIVGTLPVAIFGLASREPTSIEEGPTGPFLEAALARWRGGRTMTAAGRAHVCLACGHEYPAKQPFCEACGVWPGETG